ncbi:hypothetical protein TWF696_009364 [Orbilia brochopaga]|uniref:Nucleolar 27S pre-rRNA processing Urb2/Npa2 C-terminal domain-containing protein n=1 Tax=Orbilia brochopaga TaxID=3140254 RepID=A0AAV9UJG2_9PEZI
MRLQSTAALTKSLRDKKKPLLDLLPVAQAVCRNKTSIFFPGKEEWLVEWLVERLDDSSSLDGRLSPEAWDILYELLAAQNLNFTIAAATLKKHKFVAILARTLSDAVARYKCADDKSSPDDNNNASGDVEMHNAATATSPTSSSATEPGSPVVRFTFGRQGSSSRVERRTQVRQGQQIHTLLTSVFRVVELLRTRFERSPGGTIENSKRRRLDLTTPVLKHSPEAAAVVLESYLRLLDVVVQGLGYVEDASGWTHSCLLIWKSCSHGISDAAKLVNLVSEKLMCPIAKLLCFRPLPADIRDLADWIFGTYIFQPISGPKEKQQDFLQAFKPLADACSGKGTGSLDSKSALHSLPVVLELAIEKADRDYSVKQRRQADGFVSVLLSWMLSLADTQTSIHSQLLDIAIRHKVTVESAALKKLVNSALRVPYAVDWKLLQAIVKIDLDILLSVADSAIFPRVSEYDIRTCDEDIWGFVEQLVATSVEARDLESLIERWMKLLSSTYGAASNIWSSDRFQSLISKYTETGLTQNQILNILTTCASFTAGLSSSVVIDSILRGINRIETIDKLSSNGVDSSLFKCLSRCYLEPGLQMRWQCLRTLLRTLEMWSALDLSPGVEPLKEGVLDRTRTLLAEADTLGEDAAKELSLLLTMAFVLRERSCLSIEELELIFKGYIDLFPKIGKSSALDSWDGSFDSMSFCANCVIACLYMLAERFVPIICQLDRPLIQQFVVQFFEAASQAGDAQEESVSLRSAWAIFVKADSSVYDNLLIKDSLFNGVITTLKSQSATRNLVSLVVEMLSQCPLSALRKSQREAFLDILFQYTKNATGSSEKVNVFDALNRLARLSTNSSSLATSSGSRDGLYSFFAKNTDSNLEVEIDLATSVIKHLTESRHDEKATNQLAAAINLATELLDQSNMYDIGPRAWAYCIIQGTLESQHDGAIKSKLESLISKISTMLTRDLIISIEHWDQINDFDERTMDLKLLEALVSRDAYQSAISGIRNQVEPLLVNIDWALVDSGDSVITPQVRQRLLFYGRLICAISDDDGTRPTDIALSLCAKGCYNKLQQSYTALISRLGVLSLRSLIEYITHISFPLAPPISPSYFTILRDILTSASAKSLSDPQIETQITFLLSQLIMAIPTCDNFEALCTLLSIMNTLLKDKGLSMSQSNVEELLASIVVTASRFGPRFNNPEANTDAIFIPLCSILANNLSSQRFRIKGRHGLFVSALEALMTLLFLPRVAGRRKTDMGIHPPWLSSLKSWTVTKEAAIAYCRLLTMLCNPSTSSVRLNRKADSLSSATVAAKKAVEIHVPSLLNKYISLSLTCHLASDVRAALTPGLYAMFDVMQPSTLRSLNMSLDNPGRVIFKSLYEDWNKFGKWVD